MRIPQDELFSYPLSLPACTLYEELGLDLAASDDEILSAKAEATIRLQAEKSALDQELEKVYAAVEGLKEAYAELPRIEGESNLQVRAFRKRLADLERDAQGSDPDFKKKRERAAELELRIHVLNRSALDKPEQRRAYGRAHPPLALLELADGTADSFAEGKTALFLLRRELSRFLAAQGEPVFHPSDFTREDFSSDFHHNPLLDGAEHEHE
jgi:hypothetical protein